MNETLALPVVSWLKGLETNSPYLEGSQCCVCDVIFSGDRLHCSRCGARGKFKSIRLASEGSLYSYSIVYRSFPGVDVPYISAIVDLDMGGTIKGNLINVDPKPESIEFGMQLEVVFGDALGRKDKAGNSYISYFFQPTTRS